MTQVQDLERLRRHISAYASRCFANRDLASRHAWINATLQTALTHKDSGKYVTITDPLSFYCKVLRAAARR